MTIPAAPAVPMPTSSTFAADAYAFTQWQATLGPAIDAETQRLNSIGFGSYNTTSTTSLTIGTGSKSLTIETGKSFTVGQAVMIASTAGPTNYMVGQVTSYNSGTGALVVNVTSVAGSGTVAAWTVSVAAVVAGGGVSPDSIVVLTSGTSWTCPAGVTKVRARISGPGGAGAFTSYSGSGGGGGGTWETIATVTPGSVYAYAIGASSGATTSMTIGGATHTAYSGGAASGNDGGSGGSATGSNGVALMGTNGSASQYNSAAIGRGGCAVTGYGRGGDGLTNSSNGAPTAGAIILELYK